MLFEQVKILGTGICGGDQVEYSDHSTAPEVTQVRDPFLGREDDQGNISIAGLSLSPQRYPRTLESMRRAFSDPFRGVAQRHIFPADLAVSDAEAEAAKRALAGAGISARDIDVLLVQSFLGDELQPNNAPLVAHKLGMTHVAAWSVDSVCNSLLSQLSTASALIASGAARRVLCVQSAAYSRVNDPSISSSRQEGDLAAAVVVGAGTGRIATAWQTDGSCHSANTLQWQTVGAANPWWVQPDAKLLIHFDKSQQPATLQRLQDLAPVVCGAALQEMDQDFHDVSLFIGHQVSAWMLDFISETLGISDDMAFNTFARYGNVNAPGLTASLHEAIAAGRCETGSKLLIFGPAAGLSFGAAVLEW